jgi:hypothetical protein
MLHWTESRSELFGFSTHEASEAGLAFCIRQTLVGYTLLVGSGPGMARWRVMAEDLGLGLAKRYAESHAERRAS